MFPSRGGLRARSTKISAGRPSSSRAARISWRPALMTRSLITSVDLGTGLSPSSGNHSSRGRVVPAACHGGKKLTLEQDQEVLPDDAGTGVGPEQASDDIVGTGVAATPQAEDHLESSILGGADPIDGWKDIQLFRLALALTHYLQMGGSFQLSGKIVCQRDGVRSF